MGDVFGKPAIVYGYTLYTAGRTGLAWWKDLKELEKVEMALWKIIPPRRKRLLPSPGFSWAGGLHCQDKAFCSSAAFWISVHETGLKRRDEDEKDRFNCLGDHACRSKYQRLCVGCKRSGEKQVLQDQEGEDEAKEEDKKKPRGF